MPQSASQLKCGFWDVREEVVDAECRLEFQKVIGYHQTSRAELALDHLKAHLFLLESLTRIEDLFPTWSVKLMKMHILLNLCSSISRATRLNGAFCEKWPLLENIAGNVFLFNLILFRCYI